ncbi:hypothetical protein L1049_014204 [Liquidambar formosana]|uniref:Uncharacterized protein n=1 Tax=Liquidambar formosana TaxID=63359 RepID=A0AAP0RLP7_LIQFO
MRRVSSISSLLYVGFIHPTSHFLSFASMRFALTVFNASFSLQVSRAWTCMMQDQSSAEMITTLYLEGVQYHHPISRTNAKSLRMVLHPAYSINPQPEE